MMKRITKVAIGAMAVFCSIAQADTAITFADVDRNGKTKQSGRLEIGHGKIRMGGMDSQEGYMIFDPEAEAIIAVNTDDRTYFVVDEAFAAQVGDMQSQVMAQMEAQLAQLPPAQREQVKKMMMQRMPQMDTGSAPKAQPPEFRSTGKSRTVADWRCDVIQVYQGREMKAEQCVVDPGELDIPRSDFETMVKMQELALKIADKLGPMGQGMAGFSQMMSDRMPVEYIDYDNGRPDQKGRIESVNHAAIDAARFEIPSGFKRQEIPQL